MSNNEMELRQRLAEVGQAIFRRNLTWGTAGNLSGRLDENHFLVSAAGTTFETLTPEDLVVCEIQSEAYLGDRKPSSETPVHRAIYRNRPDAGTILHASPFYTTLLACTDQPIPCDLFPEAMFYVRKVVRVPYFQAGSRELAEAAGQGATEGDAIVLNNHGMLAIAEKPTLALQRLESLEVLCRTLVEAQQAGLKLNFLGEQEMQDYISRSAYKNQTYK